MMRKTWPGSQQQTSIKQPASTLKMEATWPSETSVHFQLITRYYIQDDTNVPNHRYENLKSYETECIYFILGNIQVHSVANMSVRSTEGGSHSEHGLYE
jgi:hypothetical protein